MDVTPLNPQRFYFVQRDVCLFVLPQNDCANNGHFLVGGLVFSLFSFFFGGLIALRGLACLTYGGGLSLAAAAAAAAAPLHFWFRAQAAVQFYSAVLCCAVRRCLLLLIAVGYLCF